MCMCGGRGEGLPRWMFQTALYLIGDSHHCLLFPKYYISVRALILCLEPWQALFWVDALWEVLTAKYRSSHFVPVRRSILMLFLSPPFLCLSILFLPDLCPPSETTHCCPRIHIYFFLQPLLLPHKVDMQMHPLKLCPSAGFFLSSLFLDLPWVRMEYSNRPFSACTHIWMDSSTNNLRLLISSSAGLMDFHAVIGVI